LVHQPGGRRFSVDLDLLGVEGEGGEDVAVFPGALGRGGADVALRPGVVREVKGAWRQTRAGLVAGAGGQLGDVASGSTIVTTKLFVPVGKPLQESCGETSWPPAPNTPLTCGIASFSPSRRSVLVSEKEAAGGRFS